MPSSTTGEERLDLSSYFRDNKPPESETFRAIFNTSGRNLEADTDKQEPYVFLCIFPCWERTFTVATVVLNLCFLGRGGKHYFLYFSAGAWTITAGHVGLHQ